MAGENLYKSIFLVLEDIRQDMIDQYEQFNIRASGAWERNIKIARKSRTVMLSMPFYTEFIAIKDGNIQSGKGGNKPPINKIVEWMKAKGIQPRNPLGRFMAKTPTNYRRSAFAIATKIQSVGTDKYLGKRPAIDIDKIITNVLDYRGNEIGDRIIQDIKPTLDGSNT